MKLGISKRKQRRGGKPFLADKEQIGEVARPGAKRVAGGLLRDHLSLSSKGIAHAWIYASVRR